ncbi:SAF domain-containing protein [Rudaeicoccus suwonensis]|uniref:Flp pilus assembly protein CpaB n=1 Tax=Rudaeicoccus suwonensis TaxID=657409 RepID=A0A561E801_9MICO|nr:SAF domain-containing protein [Rudaeicoccus suwonensis]TWE11742.1 Flp pilus assembly protein CpaB [Rudaeicoccus suwonensis]
MSTRDSTRPPAWQRLLPDPWQGPSRQAQWRRGRARRVLCGLLLAAAVLALVSVVRPPAPATTRVLVAARDLPAGHRLTAADVRGVAWPAGATVPGILAADAVTGTLLVAPIHSGEPLTASRVRAAGRWSGVADGQVVVSVPVTQGSVAQLVQPGDHIDLYDGASGRPIGTDLAVVLAAGTGDRADEASASSGSSSTASGTTQLQVAVSRSQAAAIATANAAGGGVGGGLLVAASPSR